MQESIVFLLRVQCRRKESSRSLSHLLMSFLFNYSASALLAMQSAVIARAILSVCPTRSRIVSR